MAFDRGDIGGSDFNRFNDVRERNRVQLPLDTHHDRGNDRERKGKGQNKSRAHTRLGLYTDTAVELGYNLLYHIHPHTAA